MTKVIGKTKLDEMYVAAKFIANPRIIAPATAPNKLSRPPITADTNPKTNKTLIEVGYKDALGTKSIPANAPAPPANAQPRVLMLFTLIPDKLAISGEYAEARKASPTLVF